MPKRKNPPASTTLDIEVLPDNGGPSNQLARYAAPVEDLAITPVFDIDAAKKRMGELQNFVQAYMIPNEDYGIIPGTAKPTLFKSGADKLCDIYGMADSYRITNRVEDWDKNLFDYEVECVLTSKRTQKLIATGLGSCNSYEDKYHFRDMKRTCPSCNKPTVIKGNEKYGGGWVCWKKEGKSDGCGAKYPDNDKRITEQMIGRTVNDRIPDLKNTLLKMAKKRAKVDAVLSATRSSGLFTQDMEDLAGIEAHEEQAKSQPAQQARPAQQQAQPAAQQPPKASPPPQQKPPIQQTKPPAAAKPPAAPPPAQQAAPPPQQAPVSNETKPPEAKKDVMPPKTSPLPGKKPTRSERAREIASSTGTSSTNLMAFMAKTLSVDMNDFNTVGPEKIEACMAAVEECIAKFPGKQVGKFMLDDPFTEESIRDFFNERFSILSQ